MNFHREPNTFVGHVQLKVENLEKSLKFYQEIIGFQILEQTKTTAKLTTDGKTSLLSLVQLNNSVQKKERTTGIYHFALLLPQRSDLADILKHFIETDTPIGSSDHLVSEAIYLSDPDGNGIEIYIDRPSSEWIWRNDEVEMSVDPLNFRGLMTEIKDETWQGLPENTLMGHIHLHVSHLKDSEDFYVDGLGFNVVNRYGTQALFLSTGKYHHHIGLNTWAGVGAPPPLESNVGMNWFALVYPSDEARKKVITQLEEMGASVKEENGVYVTEDPSYNKIQLWV